MHFRLWAATAAIVALPWPVAAQSPSEIHDKIRKEATGNSQILDTLHYLTDLYGPRLTGSPRHEASANWAKQRLREWGMANARLEPWEFGHPGWENERIAVHLLAPAKDTLTAEALGWTPGTRGRVKAAVVHMVPPENPTKEKLEEWLQGYKAQVKGRVVLTGAWRAIPVSFATVNKRTSDEDAKRRYAGPVDQAGPGGPQRPAEPKPAAGVLTARQVEERLTQFLVENKAAARGTNAQMAHGTIRAFQNRTYDVAKAAPTFVLKHEDFGRLVRLMEKKREVRVEVEIVNRSYPAGRTTYNVVADLPGTDKKGEYVMLGGHLDSWHAATGATDNAIGCAVMMEAVRILKTLNVPLRRSVRIGLWSGEEQGLLGSKAYVKQHLGTAENPLPEAEGFVGYFNIDAGTGRARGLSVFGPPAAATMLRDVVKPLADLGVAGAVATRTRAEGGSDHTSFNVAGFAGIGVGQDPIEYFQQTWHTNHDTYERIMPEDAQKSAAVIAIAVYELANREERLPRFTKEQMPAAPKPRGES